jgi:peptidase E
MSKQIFLCSGGAGKSKKQMIEDFRVALNACGVVSPAVAYIGAADSDGAHLWNAYRSLLKKSGAGDIRFAPIARKTDIDAARRIFTESDAVFISDGDAENGMAWLKKFELDKFLKKLYESGKLFFGVSAGCIMMGRHWVHWDKDGDDDTASLFDCLDFVPYTFDVHGEEENWKGLKCATRLLGDGAVGCGLSDGGFYSVDAGNLFNFRSAPSVYRNTDGTVKKDD